MLQQTQVDRVVPKFTAFIKKWPTVSAVSKATLGEVLRMWQGLGYNRRAKHLHECAKIIMEAHSGRFPKDQQTLQTLSGIGPYTAAAIMNFAYEIPTALIETNVRTVFLHHFFPDATNVKDVDLVRYIELTMDSDKPREWYWALMDYGAYIKKQHGNPNQRSRHYTKQSPFAGSDRQVRGAIVRALAKGPLSKDKLEQLVQAKTRTQFRTQLESLCQEKLVNKTGNRFTLP